MLSRHFASIQAPADVLSRPNPSTDGPKALGFTVSLSIRMLADVVIE